MICPFTPLQGLRKALPRSLACPNDCAQACRRSVRFPPCLWKLKPELNSQNMFPGAECSAVIVHQMAQGGGRIATRLGNSKHLYGSSLSTVLDGAVSATTRPSILLLAFHGKNGIVASAERRMRKFRWDKDQVIGTFRLSNHDPPRMEGWSRNALSTRCRRARGTITRAPSPSL
jgi:hypothetical protein